MEEKLFISYNRFIVKKKKQCVVPPPLLLQWISMSKSSFSLVDSVKSTKFDCRYYLVEKQENFNLWLERNLFNGERPKWEKEERSKEGKRQYNCQVYKGICTLFPLQYRIGKLNFNLFSLLTNWEIRPGNKRETKKKRKQYCSPFCPISS